MLNFRGTDSYVYVKNAIFDTVAMSAIYRGCKQDATVWCLVTSTCAVHWMFGNGSMWGERRGTTRRSRQCCRLKVPSRHGRLLSDTNLFERDLESRICRTDLRCSIEVSPQRNSSVRIQTAICCPSSSATAPRPHTAFYVHAAVRSPNLRCRCIWASGEPRLRERLPVRISSLIVNLLCSSHLPFFLRACV